MEKAKGVMGAGQIWVVDFFDNSTTPSSRDIFNFFGFTRLSTDQVTSIKEMLSPEAYILVYSRWSIVFNCNRTYLL
ncbi:pro-apoptotic serine protease [Gossypium arboreum]|uniref:Pro-apoptotic serine protease n=1 Tax=Gossypium arboreum TaxID=29729 RepID=A0A0B0NEV1_GOSAR|nr:pro-apoptotic serine protease [Gossypium arboreum]